MNKKKDIKGFSSLCVKETWQQPEVMPHISPIFTTSSFAFETPEQGIGVFKGTEKGHSYSRYGNPNMDAVAQKIADMETHGLGFEAWGIMVSSGMAAISTTVLALLSAGDAILTQGNLYGGTNELFVKILEKFGIKVLFCNLKNLEEVENYCKKYNNIKVLYFETPANPTLSCVDIEALCIISQKFNILTVADNTFPTPYLQRPMRFGTDVVIHSTTKYLNGHGNAIAGTIVVKDLEHRKAIWQAMKLLGTNCNAFDAWLANNGIKTLEIRMLRHCENAMSVAKYLAKHAKVSLVNYIGLPSHADHALAVRQMDGFGGMLSFDLGSADAALRFMRALKFCTLAPTLGDVDTLVLHPATSSHLNVPQAQCEHYGITQGLVRLSIGIESLDDILEDIEQALSNV